MTYDGILHTHTHTHKDMNQYETLYHQLIPYICKPFTQQVQQNKMQNKN